MSTPETLDADIRSLAIIGFGEVGQALAKGLKPFFSTIATYDILFDDEGQGARLKEKARLMGVVPVASPAELGREDMLVISSVTAGAAAAAVGNAATWIRPDQYYLDVNSISPAGKQSGAKAIETAGGRYVEAVIMSPIHPKAHRSPMLFGGPAAENLAKVLQNFDMDIQCVSRDIGVASANKLCRSVIIKGLEALVVESLLSARHYGVDQAVLDSLDRTYPGMDWRKLSAYMIERVLVHGRRRAEEMRAAADTVGAAGMEPLMAAATAERQQWLVDHIERDEALSLATADLTTMLDRLTELLQPAG